MAMEGAAGDIERIILQSLGHSVAAVDLDAKLIYWNKFAERLYGWRADEVIGCDARSIAAPPLSEEESRRIHALVLAGDTWIGELPLQRRDGSRFEAVVICAPLRDGGGELIGTVTSSRDVSARADVEAAVRQTAASLSAAQRIAKLGSWQFEAATGVVRWSDQLFEIFGIPKMENGPGPAAFLQSIHPEDRQRVNQALQATLHEGRELEIEHRIVVDGAVKMIRARGHLTRHPDGTPHRIVGTAFDITQRWEAEEALRKSERSLATAQRIARLGNWDWNPETGEAHWSKEVFRLFGLDPEHVQPSFESYVASLHREDRERVVKALDRVLAAEQRYSVEYRVIRHDNDVRVIREEGEVSRNKEGHAVQVSGTVQDITERWQAEDAHRRSEERFRATFEQAPVGICELTFEGAFARVNPRLCAFLGYSSDELQARSFMDVTYPDDVAPSLALIAELSAGKRDSVGLDKRYIHKDGHVLWAHSTVSLIREPEDGKPCGLIAITEDISARRAAEERLRFQADMLDSVGEAVIATKPDGTLIYWNRYAESLYRWRKEEALGRNVVDLLAPAGPRRQASEDAMARLSAGQRTSGEYLLRRSDDSTFEAFASATPIINSKGEVEAVIGVSNDISERKDVQRQLAESEAQLRALTARLQRLREEERTRIAREIHDELGQMLTGLKLDLRWVQHRLEALDTKGAKPITERVVAGMELTGSIIKAVQAIAADLRPSVLDTFGLAPALEFEASRFERRTGIQCAIDRPAEIQPLSADVTTALFRIFQECLTNVARHSEASRVDVFLEVPGGDAHLVVQDNGIGITNLPRAAAGSLGIVGIRERVGLLNGTVSFSSDRGEGTRVEVRIPKRQIERSPDAGVDR